MEDEFARLVAAGRRLARTELVRSSASLLASDVAAAALTLVFLLLVARQGGPTARGVLAFVSTLPVLLSHAGTLGLNSASLYFARREPEQRDVLVTSGLVVGLSVGAIASVAAFALFSVRPGWVPNPVTPGLLAAGLASTGFLCAQVILESSLIGGGRVGPVNLVRVAMPASSIAGILVLPLIGEPVGGSAAVWAWIGGRLLGFLITVFFSVTYLGLAGVGRTRIHIHTLLRFGLPAHGSLLLDLPVRRLDTLVLGAVRGAGPVGVYTAAVNIAELLLYFPRSVSSMLLTAGAARSDEEAKALIRRAMWYVVLGSTVAAVVGAIFAPEICILLFGAEFESAAGPLRILLIGMVGFSVRWVYASGLSARGRPGLASVAALPPFLAIVGLNLFLIPRFGVMGAAWSSLLSYWLGGAVMFFVNRRADRKESLLGSGTAA
ncbi:MAG: flippase [Actinomycetota bacterium]